MPMRWISLAIYLKGYQNQKCLRTTNYKEKGTSHEGLGLRAMSLSLYSLQFGDTSNFGSLSDISQGISIAWAYSFLKNMSSSEFGASIAENSDIMHFCIITSFTKINMDKIIPKIPFNAYLSFCAIFPLYRLITPFGSNGPMSSLSTN